jgi:hypothetical protein
VKYMLLIYSNPETWARMSREMDRVWAEHYALTDEIAASGEAVGGQALSDPSHTRTVRLRDGAASVTDGPFAETKEHLAGFYVVDCDSAERAIEIAARIPDARYNAVEVRPIVEIADP